MAQTENDEVSDIPVAGKWFCIRCESERPAMRRVNALGAAAIGAFVPVGVNIYATLIPALAKQMGTDAKPATGDALFVGVVIAAVLASLVLGLVKGAGRTLICTVCEHTEIVPADSPRAKRVALAAEAEMARNASSA